MSDQVSRCEDPERTDVLPQFGVDPDGTNDDNAHKAGVLSQLNASQARHSTSPVRQVVAPFGAASQATSENGQIRTLPLKPSPTDLASS
jgi:hypothetical protein